MTTRAALHSFVIALALAAILATAAGARAQLDAPLIDTRSAASSTNFNQETLQNIPGARDPWSVLSTTPGVLPAGEPGRPSAGTTGDALYTVDGIRIGDSAVDGAVVPDLLTIPHVEVLTGGASAEYGDAAGGVIQVVTKRGTKAWQGSGRFVVDGDEPSGLGAVRDPSIRIDITQDAAGGYCLNGFQVMSAGQPVADRDGPVQFAFDQSFTIGVTSGPGTSYGAGDGSLNLSQIPGCAGQPFGLTFIDTPAPYTPPDPTHLFLGQNGSYLVDMGRIGASYGIPDRARTNANALEDNHIFRSGFYLAGKVEYVDGGFRLAPRADAIGGRGEPGGAPNGVFLYGIDPGGIGRDWSIGSQLTYDSKAIRTGDPPAQLPDIDGDGKPDSVFLPLAMLTPMGQNAIGGGFRAGAIGSGGGTLAADPTWASAADDAGVPGTLERFSPGARNEFTLRRDPDDGPGDARDSDDLGGPIIKDRLWIWGSYDMPGQEAGDEDTPALFSESFYESRPDYTQLFRDSSFTEESVQRAPGGRGVQGIGLEVDGQANGMERSWSGDERFVPGGAVALATALDSPILYVVAQGGPTGEVFRVQVVQPESGPVEIHGLVAVEPVAATAEDRARFERELDGMPGEKYTMTAAGYCLDMDALAPPAGTVYRVAPSEKQEAFAPMRRALDAARRLRDAGALHPDSDPEDYYHSVRQWAVWTVEKGFDRAGFLDAFVARMEQNFREAGRAWSPDVAAAVRSFGEGRWTDIAAILEAANAPSP